MTDDEIRARLNYAPHPWLRINRALRVMLQTRRSVEAGFSGQDRVQEGARAVERDPARGVVQLT
jgi:hypothetical protein